MIDAQYFDKTGVDNKYLSALQSKLFVKFCASEFSLENYIALYCVMAYQKKPSLERLIAFTEVFLQSDSPMELNTNSGKATEVKNCLAMALELSEKVEERIKKALDAMRGDVLLCLNDTFARFSNQVLAKNAKYDFLFSTVSKKTKVRTGLFAYRYKSKYTEYIKKLSDMTASDFNIKSGLQKLEIGGFPTTKMGLMGVVPGY